jgi:uncharacterized protein (DUF433 family)
MFSGGYEIGTLINPSPEIRGGRPTIAGTGIISDPDD